MVLLVIFVLKGLPVIRDVGLILDWVLAVGGREGSLISICTTFLSVCFTAYIYCIGIDYPKFEIIQYHNQPEHTYFTLFSTHLPPTRL